MTKQLQGIAIVVVMVTTRSVVRSPNDTGRQMDRRTNGRTGKPRNGAY